VRVTQRAGLPPSFFKDPAESRIAETLAGRGKRVTVAALENAYTQAAAANDPTAETIKRMIEGARQGANPAGKPQIAVRIAQQAAGAEAADAAAMRTMDKYVIGQENAKIGVCRFLDSLKSGLGDEPMVLAIAGPPGVGKTELARGVAAVVHDDPEMYARVEGNQIGTAASLNSVISSPKSFVGYEKNDTASPLSITNLRLKFGDKRPVVVLLDETDKIGAAAGGDEAQKRVKDSFWNTFGTCFETGWLTMQNGERVDLRGAVFIITSNVGQDEAKGLGGQALRDHYIRRMKEDLPPHLVGRIHDYVAADPLEIGDTQQIAKKIVEGLCTTAKKAAFDAGKEIDFQLDPSLTSLLAEIGVSEAHGARPLKTLVTTLLRPALGRVAQGAQDEETWSLGVPADLDQHTRAQMVKKFRETAPAIPHEYTSSTFPIEFTCKNPKPTFHAYEGSYPCAQGMPLSILASGAVGGRGFVVQNEGLLDSKNTLYILRPGAVEAEDNFVPIALPEKLAEGAIHLDAVALDDQTLLFTAVGIEKKDKGEEAKSTSYLFDSKTREFKEVAPIPVPLVGASMGAVAGEAVVFGGRMLFKGADDNWSVRLDGDPTGMSGEPIENLAYRYDAKNDRWEPILDAPATGRTGAAVVEHDGKLWFFGGEEVYLTPQQVSVSRASKAVDVYDPATEKFSVGPELPSAVAYASAFKDPAGRIQVAGGVEFLDYGRDLALKSNLYRIDPSAEQARWRTNDTLPDIGAKLAVIPHAAGHLTGPFVDAEGHLRFEMLA
jgi:SpoVK/Ycf46/Vps4 family AAA+-type ATPase